MLTTAADSGVLVLPSPSRPAGGTPRPEAAAVIRLSAERAFRRPTTVQDLGVTAWCGPPAPIGARLVLAMQWVLLSAAVLRWLVG